MYLHVHMASILAKKIYDFAQRALSLPSFRRQACFASVPERPCQRVHLLILQRF